MNSIFHRISVRKYEDKPVEKGNIAVIDFEGFVDEKAFEGGKAEGYELELSLIHI